VDLKLATTIFGHEGIFFVSRSIFNERKMSFSLITRNLVGQKALFLAKYGEFSIWCNEAICTLH